jgi:polyisoprenoid-binding protein YceI
MRRVVVGCIVLCAVLVPGPVGAQHLYDVNATRSHIVAVTHRAGLFSFLGHEHAILATEFTAVLCLVPETPSRSTLRIAVPTRSLVIDSDTARALAHLGGGPGADTRIDIARKMIDEQRLHADAHPTLSFESTAVERARADTLQVRGRLTIRGVTQDVAFPAVLSNLSNGAARLVAKLRIQLRKFGIVPETVAGVVRVANDVDLNIDLVATQSARECGAGEVR